MTKTLFLAFFLSYFYVTQSHAKVQPLSTPLSAQVSVTGQINLDQFNQLLNDGFKSVIVNRLDQDFDHITTVQQLRQLAEQKQISVMYQPLQSKHISQADIQEFAKYYNELPKPILMVCRSGTRSSALFNQAKSQGLLHE